MAEVTRQALELIPAKDGYWWEHLIVEVPDTWTEQQIQDRAPHYRNWFGQKLEAMGFTVIGITPPMKEPSHRAAGVVFAEPGKVRRVLHAYVKRRPVEYRISLPDALVPQALKEGARLLD